MIIFLSLLFSFNANAIVPPMLTMPRVNPMIMNRNNEAKDKCGELYKREVLPQVDCTKLSKEVKQALILLVYKKVEITPACQQVDGTSDVKRAAKVQALQKAVIKQCVAYISSVELSSSEKTLLKEYKEKEDRTFIVGMVFLAIISLLIGLFMWMVFLIGKDQN